MIAEGLQNKEMATALGVSDKTVEHHRQNVMKKLDLHDVAALTRYAIRHRMLTA
jgi:DNA-binding NarL/FixJ family response regulator